MTRRIRPALAAMAAAVLLAGCAPAQVDPMDAASADADLVQPGTIHLGGSSVDDAAPIVLRAQQLYTFWDTGDASWIDRAVDDAFEDQTLPDGRPQGTRGLVAASDQFRTAIPDLHCELVDLYVTGDTFTARLTFTGHFTGTYGDAAGTGRAIEFGAIDIQRIGDSGQIVEDWHIEDNLTFLQQAGLVQPPTP